MNNLLIRKIQEIQELQDITEVYWKQKGYADEPHTLQVGVKDVNGKEVLTPFPKELLFSPVMNVLIVIVLSKASNDGIVILPWDLTILSDEVNAARKRFPYTGEMWINEAQARLYDYIEPEYKF